MSADATSPAAERLMNLFDRMRQMALGENPVEESGVTGPQLALLSWMAGAPGCGVQDLAAGLDLTAPTVSVGVRKLEAAGLVERQPHPADGRAIQLFLTEQGQTLHCRSRAFRQEKMQGLLANLAPAEVDVLLTLLKKAIRPGAENR